MLAQSSLEPLYYNDILLLPQHSDIESRDEINLYNTHSYIPVFSAPMLNISEPELVIELGHLGGVGILHRFFEHPEDRYNAVETISPRTYNYGVSIGIHDWEEELDFTLFAGQHGCNFVVIDTASGYLTKTVDAVNNLYQFRSDNNLTFHIISGNVVDYAGCVELAKAGTDMIRVNIGTGLQCLTSKSIGIGCPPLTAIRDCARIKDRFPGIPLLADGGIYTPGDALKALVFGADGIMIGSLLGKAKEANNNGIIFGMSSYELQERMNKTKKSNEGTVTLIPKEEIKPLKEIFNEFAYGLKSGLSYLGVKDINDLHDAEIEYIKVK